MALTAEQIKQMDEIAGVETPTPLPATGAQAENVSIGRQRSQELRELAKQSRAEKRKAQRTLPEKIADVTGGREISKGLGQALAMKENTKLLEETQQQQFDIQGQLLKRIKEKKERGEDTSRLEGALEELTQETEAMGESAERQFLNQEELTPKQIAGDALQLATTVGGLGSVKGATKLVKGAKTAIGQAGRGALVGGIEGATFGGLQGVSGALQEDKEILPEAIKGAKTGAILGSVLGGGAGLVGGIRKAGNANKLVKKEKDILDAITPNTKNISKKEYEKLLSQNRITPKTATKGSQYVLSDVERQTALKYPKLLKDKDPVNNLESIYKELSKQDDEVGKFLKKNNGIYNSGELKNALKTSLNDITDISVDEKAVTKNKQKLIDNFVKNLEKNDMESLWKARKEFDQQIEKSFTGSPTLQNKIKREFRNSIQDFIAERTPDEVYKNSMKEMSSLFKLRDLVNKKALSEKGQSAIRLWLKNNPIKAKVIGIGAPAVIGGALLLD